MITWHEAQQGTDEWLDARLGLLTASNFKTALSKGSARDTLMRRLAAEKAWHAREDSYKSAAMQRGNDMEAHARANFELDTGLAVAEVGLATNAAFPGMGASLDGIVMPDRTVGVEIKCPLASTMAEYHRSGKLPAAYREQIAAQMLICELTTVHFYSWHPDCPPFHLVIAADHFDLEKLAEAARAFVAELEEYADKLPGRI